MTMRHKLVTLSSIACMMAVASAAVSAQTPARETRSVLEPGLFPDLPTSRPPDVLLSEGRAHYDAGRYKEAAASFERAMQAGVPRPHEAAWSVARSYARLGNRKQAMRWAEIAMLLQRNPEGLKRPLPIPLLLKF